MEAFVTSSIDARGIAFVKFFHPKSNSLPSALLKKLAYEIETLGADDSVKAIMLASEGDKTFCAGASFDEMFDIKDEAAGKEYFMGFARVLNAMRKCPKFIIVRAQGKAVGGGVGLIGAADIALACREASIKLSELSIGIGPFVIDPAIERKTGPSVLGELSLLTEWRSAEWAREKGLYAEVYPSISALDEAIEKICDKFSSRNPEAMAMLKKVLWRGTEDWDSLLEERAEMSGRLVLSEFTSNAIKSFRETEKQAR
jgi:methylglutaconyl-CoA hydratase